MDNHDGFAGNLNSILLVDDLQVNATRLETYLAAYKIQLIAADHSDEALALLSVLEPDIIIINESLPQWHTLIESLQMHPRASHIPIILLTQHLQVATEKVADHCLDRLLKPINPHSLIKLLHSYSQMLACRKVVSALHNHHDQLLEAKNEGLLGLNHLGQIVYANNAAARLLGFKPSALLEIYIESLFEGQYSHVGSQWNNHPIAKICDAQNILQIEKSFFWKGDGSQLPVKFAAVPIFDEPLISMVIAFQLRKSQPCALAENGIDFPTESLGHHGSDQVNSRDVLLQANHLIEQDERLYDDPLQDQKHQSVLPRQAMHDTQAREIAISSFLMQPSVPTELVLNDYLQKVFDAALVHRASVIYLFQVNHWRHLIESLGREITPQVIKSVSNLIGQHLPEIIAVDYLENGQFCLLGNTLLDQQLMHDLAKRLQALLAQPLICLEHTLFLSVCVGATVLKAQALPQVLMHLRQAILIAQDENGDGIAVIMFAHVSHDDLLSLSVNNVDDVNDLDDVNNMNDVIAVSTEKISSQSAMLLNKSTYPLIQDWLLQQSPELQLRPFFDLQNNMIMGLNVSPLYQHPTLGWQGLDALCVHYRSNPDFIVVAQRLIELFMQRLSDELRGEDLPASCQICLKIPAALLGVMDFYAGFIQSLSEAGIAGESLWIELPESAWRVNSPIFLANIKALHLHGVGLVVSEFGQALAPLALLDKLPISAIKLASKITDHAELYRDKLWLRALKELAQAAQIKLWATQFTKQSREMLVSQLGITLTDGPSFEFSESGLSVAEFYALTQEVCLNTDGVE